MSSIFLALLLSAGPSGSLSGGRVPVSVTNTIYVAGASPTVLEITTYADVQLVEARWMTQTAGLGVGGSMSIAVNDDGQPACTLSVACNAAMASTAVQSCSNVLIAQGSVVTITVDRSSCVGAAPEGNLSYVALR